MSKQIAATEPIGTYLRKDIREWLAGPVAARLARGERDDGGHSWEMVSLLDLRFSGLVTGPVTTASQRSLARLIADPMQPVCANPEEGMDRGCRLYHVSDVAATAREHVVASASWYGLPEGEAKRWCGPHTHGRIAILRTAAGEEYAEWTDGDPTKHGAWDIAERLDVDEARRLIGLARKAD